MIRKLNVNEFLFWTLSRASPHNVVITAKISGDIDYKKLNGSMNSLLKIHPILNYSLHEEKPEFINSEIKHVYFKNTESDFSKIAIYIEEELATPFFQSDLLVRVTIVKSSNIHYLIFCFHHTISDGISGLCFINDLLEIYSDNKVVTNKLAIPDPINLYPNYNKSEYSLNETKTKIVSTILNEENISKILKILKLKKISFNGLIGSYAIKAVNLFCGKEDLFNIHVPINLRNVYGKNIENELSCITSWIELPTYLDITDELDIYISREIKKAVASNKPITNLIENYEFLNKSSTSAIINYIQAKTPTIVISNSGILKFKQKYKNFHLDSIDHFGNCQAFLNYKSSYYLSVTNLNNKTLSLNIIFPHPFMSRSLATNILLSIKDMLIA